MSLVLVADDDPDIVALLRIRLELSGHAVLTAADGAQAWSAVLAGPLPDVAVLDVTMPRLDGLELTRRLRGHAPTAELPILILTAAVQPEDVDRALAAGATAYAKKPFSPKALVARVEELLAGAQAPATGT